jgi:hypothetical protein
VMQSCTCFPNVNPNIWHGWFFLVTIDLRISLVCNLVDFWLLLRSRISATIISYV